MDVFQTNEGKLSKFYLSISDVYFADCEPLIMLQFDIMATDSLLENAIL